MPPEQGHAANMGGVEKLSDGGCGSETPKSPAWSSRHSIDPRSFMCTLLMYGRSHATYITISAPSGQCVDTLMGLDGWTGQQNAMLPTAGCLALSISIMTSMKSRHKC